MPAMKAMPASAVGAAIHVCTTAAKEHYTHFGRLTQDGIGAVFPTGGILPLQTIRGFETLPESIVMRHHPPMVPHTITRTGPYGANGVSRRKFLGAALFGLGLLAANPGRVLAATVDPPPCPLSLYHVRTGEKLDITFRTPDGYDETALAEVSRLMRDRVTGEVKPIDPHLLDYLSTVQSILETRRPFHIFSGYRSPKTNARLRRNGKGAAPNSYHLKGQAVDLWMPGIDTTTLHEAALEARAGGVGYYPERNFVHLDVGPVRHWSA